MKTILVTRHKGAIDFVSPKMKANQQLEHFTEKDIEKLEKGDIVIGILPIHLACKVCEKGARLFNLSLNLPVELRGKELTIKEMENVGCEIEEFIISRPQ